MVRTSLLLKTASRKEASGETSHFSRRSVGLETRYRYGVALEGNVSYTRAREDRYRGRAVLELGVVPGGYGWVFPKGDHANLGVGGWGSEGPRLRAHLGRLAAAHGLPLDALTDVKGHRLPMRPLGAASRWS